MTLVKHLDRIAIRDGKVLTVTPDTQVTAAARTMREHSIGSLVVVNGERTIVGIVTERDMLSKVLAEAADPAKMTVSQVMSHRVVACTLETTLSKAQQVMAAHNIRHLPIVENGELVGMLSSRDVLAHELSDARETVRHQSKVLNDLERKHPGITQIDKDHAGRVLIGPEAGE